MANQGSRYRIAPTLARTPAPALALTLGFGLTLGLATPALAGDRTGFTAIVGGNLVQAEQVLTAELRIYPRQPELMLNLAAVYARTARPTQARTLYHSVLRRPAVAMDLPSGTVRSSHDIATTGLTRLSNPQVATR